MKFIELQGFGPNMLTVAFIATIIFSLIQAYGLWEQIETIRDTQSIRSISVPYFTYFTIHFLCFTLYGFKHERLAFIVTGVLLVIMHGRVLNVAIGYGADVYRYIPIVIVLMCIFVRSPLWIDHWVIGILYCVGTVFLTLVPIQMLRMKGRGSVSIVWLATICGSVIFWLIYGLAIDDRVLVINCSVSILALMWAGYLYLVDLINDMSTEV